VQPAHHFGHRQHNLYGRVSIPGHLFQPLHGSQRFDLIWFLHSDSPFFRQRKIALSLSKAQSSRVATFYDLPGIPGSRVDPAKWPCPRATEGVTDCHQRFFPDDERKRRSRRLPDTDRKFEDKGENTFVCRFYDRLASKSPCEGLYVPLIIRIVNIEEKPIAGMAYQLTLEDAQFSGNTSPDGLIRRKVDPDAKSGTLTLDGFEREVTIVPMEYSTTVTGAKARLSNLAYGTADAQEGVLDDATQLALQRFQQRHGLTTSGQLDDATSAKLKDSYGS
jgi:hypothetical protein